MGKKFTFSQQKARAKQRAVTERIKREEAAAEAEAFQAPEAEQEAKTSDEWLPSGTTESIQAESEHPEREKPSHSGDVEVVSDSESNLATPVTPSKDPASRHLAATDGDGSTDESVSDSADSEPADLMHEDNDNHDCQSSQGSHLDHVTDSEQEAASSTPPTQQPADAKEPTELVHTESADPDHAAVPSALIEEPSEVVVEPTNNGKLSLPESVPLHACSLLQAWTPKWVGAQVNMAVFAAINVTAALAAVGQYRKKV